MTRSDARNSPCGHAAWRAAIIAVALMVLAGACSGAGDDGADGPTIAVTTGILGDVVGRVVGDAASVEVLMPRNADPHDFALSVRQIASLSDADLIVANGLDFEAGLTDALDEAENAGVPVLYLGDQLDPLPANDGDSHDDDSHDHGAEDPHWFTDPVRMADAVGLIGTAVSQELDTDDGIVAREDQTRDDLLVLDTEIRDLLTAVPDDRRLLVTNHEVFGYFAARYDLDVVGTVVPGITSLTEVSPREIAELAETIIDRDVPAIFADTSSSTDLAEALAGEIGRPVQIVELFSESLGDEGSGGETYEQMMLTNATRIRDALA